MEPKAPGAQCHKCPLQEARYCPSSGPDDASIMLIGEEPGDTEVVMGRPFSGKSGQLLDGILDQLDINRDDVRVTNTIRCKNPKHDKPPKEAIAACKPALMQEIKRVKPHVIMPMGNFAVGSVLGIRDPKITSLRGREKWVPRLNAFVFPTFHPAAILYDGGLWRDLAQDFGRLPDVLKLPPRYKRPQPTTRTTILEDVDDVVEFCEATLSEQKGEDHLLVAGDIETNSLDMFTEPILSLGWTHKAGEATVFPVHLLFGDGDHKYPTQDFWQQERNEAFHWTEYLLEHPKLRWSWHNGKFDCKFIREVLDITARVGEDTLLMHYALDERTGTQGLDYLSQQLLNAPVYKNVMEKYHVHGHKNKRFKGPTRGWSKVPYDVLAKYQGFDIDYGYCLTVMLRDMLNEPDNAHALRLYEELLLPIQNALTEVELNGIYCDTNYFDGVRNKYQEMLHGIYNRMCEQSGKKGGSISYREKMYFEKGSYNPFSIPQTKKILYEDMGLPPQHSKDQQKHEVPAASTDKAALTKLSEISEQPFVDTLMLWRTEAKLYTTYITGLPKLISPDGKTHPDYNVSGTETGRLSGSLMMTIPKPPKKDDPDAANRANIRKLYTADPRKPEPYILMQADYSQCEMRVATVRSGAKFFYDTFLAGLDLHDATAEKLYGRDYVKDDRSKAKTVNFGVLYGMSIRALARRENISYREAQEFIDDYYRNVPELQVWMDFVFKLALEQYYIETATGRRRRLGYVTKQSWGDIKRIAVNTPVQADANDMNLFATVQLQLTDKRYNPEEWQVARKLKDLGVELLLLYHDSILFHLPVRALRETVPEVRRVMEGQGDRLFGKEMTKGLPFKVDFEVGLNWGELTPLEESEWAKHL